MQSRIDPAEYLELDLRAHALLAEVPLHDVWAVDLEDGGPERSVLDLRSLLAVEEISRVNPAVRALFALRQALGRWFGWDGEPAEPSPTSFIHRLTEADRQSSLVEPGSSGGPFRTLYVPKTESIDEAINATVHAFLVAVLAPRDGGYRAYLGVYVLPGRRITTFYMALIDPFRRWIVYPALLRHLRHGWARLAAQG